MGRPFSAVSLCFLQATAAATTAAEEETLVAKNGQCAFRP
jgi:hypothetical protein